MRSACATCRTEVSVALAVQLPARLGHAGPVLLPDGVAGGLGVDAMQCKGWFNAFAPAPAPAPTEQKLSPRWQREGRRARRLLRLMLFSLQWQSPASLQKPLVCPRVTQLAVHAHVPREHLEHIVFF